MDVRARVAHEPIADHLRLVGQTILYDDSSMVVVRHIGFDMVENFVRYHSTWMLLTTNGTT